MVTETVKFDLHSDKIYRQRGRIIHQRHNIITDATCEALMTRFNR